MSNLQSTDVSASVRESFNFSVEKYPLSAVMGTEVLPTDQYGLFRDDTGYLKGVKSVSPRYVPHTTDDVCALVDAAGEAFDGDIDCKTHFRNGHYVDVKPNLAERKAVYGTADNIWPRVLIRAGYDGESFRASMGYFRDACDNMAMMSMVNGTSVCIRHTSGLRGKMDELIATFNTLKNSWSTLSDVVDHMQSREVVLQDFLNQLYPQPTQEEGRAVTVHKNRTESIVRRVVRERFVTGRPEIGQDSKISAWEAYNAIQGYVQHDAQARKGFTGEFDRIIRAANDQTVRKAERLALAV